LGSRHGGDHEAPGRRLEAGLAGGIEARAWLGQPPLEELGEKIAPDPLALGLQ
jgi:hypothetical protein